MQKRVLVGMSGGVDSAVAAHLLLEQGYDVIAGFMNNYTDEDNPDCHTRQDRDMAMQVSQHLGIKAFEVFDFRQAYHETIIQYIYDTYQQGLTPNPDILCNSEVKFKLFLQEALDLSCDYVATGHYARIKTSVIARDETEGSDVAISGSKQFKLLKGIDQNKDQSYFLSGLNQFQLSKSLFPLGELTKPEVRAIAEEIKLPNADRKDSQGLCFIGKVDMKSFLAEALPKKKGNIIDTTGKILGEHEGVCFYTIGQRQGLGLAGGPWYVTQRDVQTNTLIVGPEDTQDLFHTQLRAKQLHRIGETKILPLVCQAKIRYRQADQACIIHPEDTETIRVDFTEAQRAISPGQTIAFYLDDELIASAIIEK